MFSLLRYVKGESDTRVGSVCVCYVLMRKCSRQRVVLCEGVFRGIYYDIRKDITAVE